MIAPLSCKFIYKTEIDQSLYPFIVWLFMYCPQNVREMVQLLLCVEGGIVIRGLHLKFCYVF
jgi:hypothetical protein